MSYAQTARRYLSSWITHLLTAVPIRSRATFVELLCGCLVSPEGWVTRAISAIVRGRHWTTYYKLLERGNVQTLRLARALFEVVSNTLPTETLNLVIDDTLVPRQSVKAPGSVIRHDHAKKSNRPQFLQAQCWVTLGISVFGCTGRKYVLPIVSRLVPSNGNRNNLVIALKLVRSLAPVMMNKSVRLLFDSWFMRARLVLPLLPRKIQVIGQARYDTALFMPPEVPPKPRCGRPKIYGIKITPEAIQRLPATEVKLTLYGKEQLIRLRTVIAKARFLKGVPVRAVWCEFYDADKLRWSKTRLLLATETQLGAEEILHLYAHRWGIEPLFHNLKRWWGVNNLWQQKHTVLELWMQIRSTVGSALESGYGRGFSYRHCSAMAQQTTTDRWPGGAMASHGIYRTCVQRRLQPEVLDIHLAKTAWRPKNASVILPPPASIINLARFIPDLCHCSGDAGGCVDV